MFTHKLLIHQRNIQFTHWLRFAVLAAISENKRSMKRTQCNQMHVCTLIFSGQRWRGV